MPWAALSVTQQPSEVLLASGSGSQLGSTLKLSRELRKILMLRSHIF